MQSYDLKHETPNQTSKNKEQEKWKFKRILVRNAKIYLLTNRLATQEKKKENVITYFSDTFLNNLSFNPYSAKKKIHLKMSSAEVVCCK